MKTANNNMWQYKQRTTTIKTATEPAVENNTAARQSLQLREPSATSPFTEPLDSAILRFSSVQDGIYALGKAHMRSAPCLKGFPNVAFETAHFEEKE